MNMRLLTNGCSFTWGGELPEHTRAQTVWPVYLAELLNIPVTNLAEGCGSNRRIYRTTRQYLETAPDEQLIVIIQWTHPPRTEHRLREGWSLANVHSMRYPQQPHLYERFHRMRLGLLEYEHHMEEYMIALDATERILQDPRVLYKGYWHFDPSSISEQYRGPVYKDRPWITQDGFYPYDSLPQAHPSELGHQQIAQRIYNTLAPLLA
jgi:hypothetical protein